jgi:Integrase zinc binding domain
MTTKNGLIYKNDRLYIPGYPDVKKLILEEFHQGPGGRHMGYKKTLAKVAKAYYWEKMPQSMQKFVQTCDICQRIKSSTQKPFGMLNPIPPPTNKFDTYSLDFIGPLPETKNKLNGILAIVDMFTKGVILEPIKFSDTAKDIAATFLRRVISRYGLPRKIISDRDPRFSGQFWNEIHRLLGTKVALSTAYHPQSDGQTERTNRTLETILRGQINGS